VTAGRNLEAEPTKAFFREVDLSVLKGIIIAAAHQERELIAVSLEKAAEVEPIALRLMIGHEACCCAKVEQAIVGWGSRRCAQLRKPGLGGIRGLLSYFWADWFPISRRNGISGPTGMYS